MRQELADARQVRRGDLSATTGKREPPSPACNIECVHEHLFGKILGIGILTKMVEKQIYLGLPWHNCGTQGLIEPRRMNKCIIDKRLPVHNIEHRVRNAASVVALGRNSLRQRQPLNVLRAHGAAAAADADAPGAVAPVVICPVIQRVEEASLSLPVLLVPASTMTYAAHRPQLHQRWSAAHRLLQSQASLQ